jgi:flagellar hook-length control protein FliK
MDQLAVSDLFQGMIGLATKPATLPGADGGFGALLEIPETPDASIALASFAHQFLRLDLPTTGADRLISPQDATPSEIRPDREQNAAAQMPVPAAMPLEPASAEAVRPRKAPPAHPQEQRHERVETKVSATDMPMRDETHFSRHITSPQEPVVAAVARAKPSLENGQLDNMAQAAVTPAEPSSQRQAALSVGADKAEHAQVSSFTREAAPKPGAPVPPIAAAQAVALAGFAMSPPRNPPVEPPVAEPPNSPLPLAKEAEPPLAPVVLPQSTTLHRPNKEASPPSPQDGEAIIRPQPQPAPPAPRAEQTDAREFYPAIPFTNATVATPPRMMEPKAEIGAFEPLSHARVVTHQKVNPPNGPRPEPSIIADHPPFPNPPALVSAAPEAPREGDRHSVAPAFAPNTETISATANTSAPRVIELEGARESERAFVPQSLAAGSMAEAEPTVFSLAPLDKTVSLSQQSVPSGQQEIVISVSRQISETFARFPDRPVELTLAPEELGKVRLSLASVEGAITVSVLAERPETLDLLRRNIELLAKDLRELGFSNVTFSFGGDTSKHPSGSQNQHEDLGREQPEEQGVASAPAIIPSPPVSPRGLDLRL